MEFLYISNYIHYLRISAAAEEFSFGLFMAAIFFVAYLIVVGFFVFLSGNFLLLPYTELEEA